MHFYFTKTELLIDPRRAPPVLDFDDVSPVPITTPVKYLRSMISWVKPFDVALKHRAELAESGYKAPQVLWNSSLPRKTKMRIFQSTFIRHAYIWIGYAHSNREANM